MNIFSLKYKAHKMVNILFYGIVFLVGLLIGLGIKKVDFNKLINQVLMIDNVYALNVTHSGVNYTEEYIYNVISNQYSDFSIEEYPYIIVKISKGNDKFSFIALSEEAFANVTINSITSSQFYISLGYEMSGNFIANTYDNGSFTYNSTTHSNNANGINKYTLSTYIYTSNSYYVGYTNFNVPNGNDTLNTELNQLDFSKYTLNLEFNENLFKDNEDFKQVCINNGSTYAITRIDNPENLEYMTDYDYIWFPYKIDVNSIEMFNFNNARDEEMYFKEESIFIPTLSEIFASDGIIETINNDNVYEFENLSYHFYDSKNKIDSVFDDEIVGGNLNYKGYTDKYSYYGWSSLLFNIWFDYREENDFNFFPIITFNIPAEVIIDENGKFKTIDETCFYIKKDYVISKVQLDEFNDVAGNVPTQNGDFQFSTSKNENNISTSGFISQVKKFISMIKDDIEFIRTNIYNFYLSMPLLVRMFFLSVLVILIIGLIIRMVVR